jgi:hypothetical protein
MGFGHFSFFFFSFGPVDPESYTFETILGQKIKP